MSKRPNVGVAAVIIQNRRILLGLRCGKFMPGVWGLPAGHLEFGEDVREAAIRETKEETNLDIRPLEKWDLGWGSKVFEAKHYITLYVDCEVLNVEQLVNKEPDKFLQWSWFDIDDLPVNLMSHHLIEILEKITER